jgi:hypothetical protein
MEYHHGPYGDLYITWPRVCLGKGMLFDQLDWGIAHDSKGMFFYGYKSKCWHFEYPRDATLFALRWK